MPGSDVSGSSNHSVESDERHEAQEKAYNDTFRFADQVLKLSPRRDAAEAPELPSNDGWISDRWKNRLKGFFSFSGGVLVGVAGVWSSWKVLAWGAPFSMMGYRFVKNSQVNIGNETQHARNQQEQENLLRQITQMDEVEQEAMAEETERLARITEQRETRDAPSLIRGWGTALACDVLASYALIATAVLARGYFTRSEQDEGEQCTGDENAISIESIVVLIEAALAFTQISVTAHWTAQARRNIAESQINLANFGRDLDAKLSCLQQQAVSQLQSLPHLRKIKAKLGTCKTLKEKRKKAIQEVANCEKRIARGLTQIALLEGQIQSLDSEITRLNEKDFSEMSEKQKDVCRKEVAAKINERETVKTSLDAETDGMTAADSQRSSMEAEVVCLTRQRAQHLAALFDHANSSVGDETSVVSEDGCGQQGGSELYRGVNLVLEA